MSERWVRLVVGIGLPLFGVVIVALALLTLDGPDALATHWGASGEPDASMSRSVFLGGIALLLGAGTTLAAVASHRSPVGRGDLVPPVAIATFLHWIFVGVTVQVLLANRDASVWTEARQVSFIEAFAIPVVAALFTVVAGRLVAGIGDERVRSPQGGASVARGDNERLVWLSQLSTPWPLALGGLMAVAGSVLMLEVGLVIGFVVLAAGAAAAMLATIRVTADRRGLTVGYGPFGWPSTTIDLDRIGHAEAIDVRPMEHGGWGYRGSVRLFGRAAVVLRAGEGLQLDLADGKRFVVTVNDAETAAGTINDLVSA